MNNLNSKNAYFGANAVLDYINPSNQYIPLVELPERLNPFAKDNVRIFAKLMNQTPLGNVKSIPAYNMLIKARDKGKLNNIDTIIESSSGNTILSLSIIGKQIGLNLTKAIVSNKVAPDKLNMLMLFGIQPIVNQEPMCPDRDDPDSGINKVKKWSRENNWFNAGQYDNPDNPGAHEEYTGPQIWDQTQGQITVFASALGTTGTMVGTGGYLKKRNKKIKNIGVASADDLVRLGPRSTNLLMEIDFDWKSVVDKVEKVSTVDSFRQSLNLCREGFLVGPSSGFNFQGLLQYLEKEKKANRLEKLKNSHGEIWCVFVCCDGPFAYLNEYFQFLDDQFFPDIENKELLTYKSENIGKKIKNISEKFKYEISVKKAIELIYFSDLCIGKDISIIDIRKERDFRNFHIKEAQLISFKSIENNDETFLKSIKDKTVIVFDCGFTSYGKQATQYLRDLGIKAYSVKGGMNAWAKKDQPIIRA